MFPSARASALLAAAAAFLVSNVHAIPKVSRVGRYLYSDDGSRFYIKGIAYQEQGIVVQSADNSFGEPSSFIDPLALPDACTRDLPFLQQLQVNTIRVYSVNATLNHDDCMKALSDAGIYTIIDLALPLNGSIDRTVPSWTTNLLEEYTTTIDAFSKYDNVLAFNVGNEVVVQNSTGAAPFVKAAARDVRAYLKSKGSSALVGYAAINGNSNWRVALANFLSCDPSNGNSDSTSIDLYGLNDYEWCGDSNFEASYAHTFGDYAGYNVAAYFGEYGCVTSPPRLWTEAASLFSSQMSPVWSGGVAFSYFPASSADGQFGMVTISEDGKTVTTSDDFDRLKTQYGQLSPPNEPSQGSVTAASFPACPSTNSTWLASTTLPPTPNEVACTCLESALSCRFTPATNNYTAIVGELLNTGCSLLGQAGGSCDDIGSDGAAGTYGRVSGCDPTIKASYVMSEFYERNNRDPNACLFAGNGTANPSATVSATSLASSCVANPTAVFTPSAAATGGSNAQSSGGSSSSSGSSNTSGGVSLFSDTNALVGMGVMALISAASAFFTLA